MLSDTCHDCINQLLDAVTTYDYSDGYRKDLIYCICILNEIKDDLDNCSEGENLLKKNKNLSIKIALKMVRKAVLRREMSSINVYGSSDEESYES